MDPAFSEWDGTPWAGDDSHPLIVRGEVPPAPVMPGAQIYPSLVPYVDGSSVLGLSAVVACVRLISDTVSDLPWQELSGPDDAPVKLASSRLIRRPMANMTRREWTWRVTATLALYNVAHLLYVGGYDEEGVPWSLLPLPPAAITPADPLQDPWGLAPPRYYMVGDRFVPAEAITVIRRSPWPSIPDHLSSLLKLAKRSFGAALAAETHHFRYWQAGGPTTTILKTDQEIDDNDAADIRQRWVDARAYGTEWPAVLGKGADAKAFGADPTTQDATAARDSIVADVGRYFGVSVRSLNAPRLGDSDTYANIEDEAVDLERYTLRGYIGPIQDGVSDLLPGDYIDGRRMRMDTSRLTQGSMEARARTYPPLVQAKIVDIDEARRIGFGLPPRTAEQLAAAEPAPATTGPTLIAAGATGGT
jgi:phage portal protein BeeE